MEPIASMTTAQKKKYVELTDANGKVVKLLGPYDIDQAREVYNEKMKEISSRTIKPDTTKEVKII